MGFAKENQTTEEEEVLPGESGICFYTESADCLHQVH
jgi:hypothetical protein